MAVEVLRWILGCGFLFLFGFFLFTNLAVVVVWLTKKKGNVFNPFLGAAFGCLGVIALPVRGSTRFWWIPLVFDPWGLPYVPFAAYWLYQGMKGFDRKNVPPAKEIDD